MGCQSKDTVLSSSAKPIVPSLNPHHTSCDKGGLLFRFLASVLMCLGVCTSSLLRELSPILLSMKESKSSSGGKEDVHRPGNQPSPGAGASAMVLVFVAHISGGPLFLLIFRARGTAVGLGNGRGLCCGFDCSLEGRPRLTTRQGDIPAGPTSTPVLHTRSPPGTAFRVTVDHPDSSGASWSRELVLTHLLPPVSLDLAGLRKDWLNSHLGRHG